MKISRIARSRWALAGGLSLFAAVMATTAQAAQTRSMTLISETFHDGELDNRTLANLYVTQGDDRKDPITVKVTSVRVLGEAQDLIHHARLDTSFTMVLGGKDAQIPRIENMRALARQTQAVRQAVADLLTIYSSNAEPFRRQTLGDLKTVRRRRPGTRRAKSAHTTPEPVEPGTVLSDTLQVQNFAIGHRLPVAFQCAHVTDALSERNDTQDVFNTVFNVPEAQCDAILGYGRDRVDNVFRVVQTGLDWRYESGTQLMEIESVLDRETGHLQSAAAVSREDLSIRDYCTRHGTMCAEPRPLSVQRRIELTPAVE
jgi:hypothetical protein